MTERMIENCIKKLSALEEQIAQLQEQADAIKGELEAALEGKALKAALPEIYSQYCKPASSRRFTVA